MAYTSLSELAAAMAPKVNGSSTMGVKKSTVCTRASSAVNLYTPASSAVSKPTSTFSFGPRAECSPKPGPKPLDSVWTLNPPLSRAPSACELRFFIDPYYNSGMRRTPLSSLSVCLWRWRLRWPPASRKPIRASKAPRAAPSKTAGSGCTWRAARPKSAISTATCWRPKSEIRCRPSPLEMAHDEKKDWQFFRDKAQNMLWPHVEAGVSRRTAGHRRRRWRRTA